MSCSHVDEVDALREELDELRAEVSGLRACRRAYASEFPRNSSGELDVGSIHENIRKLRAENERLRVRLNEYNIPVENL